MLCLRRVAPPVLTTVPDVTKLLMRMRVETMKICAKMGTLIHLSFHVMITQSQRTYWPRFFWPTLYIGLQRIVSVRLVEYSTKLLPCSWHYVRRPSLEACVAF